jgi:hypothetical protein
MKSGFCRYAAAVALLTVSAAVEAKGITYDCDTAANHFSELSLPVDGGAFTVSGKVQLNALVGSATYIPVARIQIASSAAPGKSPDVYAGFALAALPADAQKTPSGSPAIQMLSYSVNGKEDDVVPLSLMTKPGTVQSFSLSYDGRTVLVNLGTEPKSFPLKTNDPVVRLICSTGEFLFTDLTITSSQ